MRNVALVDNDLSTSILRVFPHSRVVGHPKNGAPAGISGPLAEVMRRRYASDAYVVQYAADARGSPRRQCRRACTRGWCCSS
jgi:hypothetical protein